MIFWRDENIEYITRETTYVCIVFYTFFTMIRNDDEDDFFISDRLILVISYNY
jgi:hypothetical protein